MASIAQNIATALTIETGSIDSSARISPAALDVPEILEHVLLYLPQEDLRTSTQVCKMFRDVIDGSKIIQKQMFLVATPWKGPVFEKYVTEHPSPIIELNPFLVTGQWADCDLGEEECNIWLDFDKEHMPDSISYMLLTRPLVPGMQVEVYVADTQNYEPLSFDFEDITLGDIKDAEDDLLEDLREHYAGQVINPNWTTGYKFLPSMCEWRIVLPGGMKVNVDGETPKFERWSDEKHEQFNERWDSYYQAVPSAGNGELGGDA